MLPNGFAEALLSEEELDKMPRIGHQIFYETGAIDVPWDEAAKIVEAHGFDAKLFPVTKGKRAYCEAIKAVRHLSRWDEVRTVVRPIKEAASYVRHQVSFEMVKEGSGAGLGEQLTYQQQLITHFDKETELITYEAPDGADPELTKELTGKIELAYDRYRTRAYRQSLLDFAHAAALTWDCVAMRSRGGIWFVPSAHDDEVIEMEKVFEDFSATVTTEGMEPVFYRLPIPDTTKMRKGVSRMLDSEVGAALHDLETELAEVVTEAKASGGQIREHVIQKRYERFRAVADKVEAYEELLNFKATEVHKRLGTLTGSLKRLMAGDVKGLTVESRKDRSHVDAAAAELKKSKKGVDGQIQKLEEMIKRAQEKGQSSRMVELTERLHALMEMKKAK
tara:strand:- start:94 stop:1269 length:1176 start_codon:yes stop_codon:yes gene_type:complete